MTLLTTKPKNEPLNLGDRLMRRLIHFIFLAILCGIVGLIITTNIPDVLMSQDHKCIRVINTDGSAGSCKELPDRYNTVFVAYR